MHQQAVDLLPRQFVTAAGLQPGAVQSRRHHDDVDHSAAALIHAGQRTARQFAAAEYMQRSGGDSCAIAVPDDSQRRIGRQYDCRRGF